MNANRQRGDIMKRLDDNHKAERMTYIIELVAINLLILLN